MSKFFYKGRIEKKPKHESYGFNTKQAKKLGTEVNPLELIGNSDEKKAEVEAQLELHQIVATIRLIKPKENWLNWKPLINKPKTTVFENPKP